MLWQNRVGIADTVVDLSLSEVLHVPQARPTEVRVGEHSLGKIRIVKEGAAQIRSLEVSPVQAGIGEINPRHIGSLKIGFR